MLSTRMTSLLSDLRTIGAQFDHAVLLTSGERTCADQVRIYQRLGKPLVKCSYHLSGDAIDVLPVSTGVGIPANTVQVDAILARMGAYAKQLGFRWGGDFVDRDPTHFDDGLRVGPASCCGGGTGSPTRRNQEGVAQTRRRGQGTEEVCVYCGRGGRIKKITRRTRRARPDQDES